jgi:hypothetical protein
VHFSSKEEVALAVDDDAVVVPLDSLLKPIVKDWPRRCTTGGAGLKAEGEKDQEENLGT